MEEEKASVSKSGSTRVRRKAICSNCRRRKSKCDSREPQCSTCVAHKSPCHYDKLPSLAYVRSLEAQVEQLRQENGMMRKKTKGTENRIQTDRPELSYIEGRRALSTSPSAGRSVEAISDFSSPTYRNGVSVNAENGDRDHWVSEISIDVHGEVRYHGPTSSFHEAPTKDTSSDIVQDSSYHGLSATENFGAQQTVEIKRFLVSNAAAQRHVEAMAVESITNVEHDITSEMANELLKYHWCWIHPTFQFVYRPAFTRDMTLPKQHHRTSYFSETLLKVVLCHCSRFRVQDSTHRDSAVATMRRLTDQACLSLGSSISQASSIPTIQALLQQSAREVAFANSSQAWLYSGMAFRMAIDLGIHLPNDKLSTYVKRLSPEDIEIRKRLFWSCYTWDKAISLYCGRMPAFTPAIDTNIPEFMDDFTENEPWTPYYGNHEQGDNGKRLYPPQKGYMISCFTGLCKLSVIVSSIMLEIYGRTLEALASENETGSVFQNMKNSAFIKISASIQKWWIELPDVIRLKVNDLPALSPPLHIVSLNLLYHTTLILLHRPFIIGATDFQNPAVSRSYQLCIRATAAIHDLLQLIATTFGYDHSTYLNCYCIYIAATIAVLHFQLQDGTASLPATGIRAEKLELKFYLGVLQRSATAMPGLNRSVEIVKRHIQSILEQRSKRYLDLLFPNTDVTAEGNTPHRPLHNQGTLYSASQIEGGPTMPQRPDDQFSNYPSFNLEELPAFPGQYFNVGNDFRLDEEITDPEMRTALLGLDPHITLHHESSDWAYGPYYAAGET